MESAWSAIWRKKCNRSNDTQYSIMTSYNIALIVTKGMMIVAAAITKRI
jgi:hypothetical protein